jgi:hypothetical protein
MWEFLSETIRWFDSWQIPIALFGLLSEELFIAIGKQVQTNNNLQNRKLSIDMIAISSRTKI